MMLLGTFRIGEGGYIYFGTNEVCLTGSNSFKGDALIVSGGIYYTSNVSEPS